MQRTVDRPFLIITAILLLSGVFIFASASLGLLAREGIQLSAVATNQAFGIVIGIILLFVFIKVPYKFWNKYSLYIFLFSICLTGLVFIPGLGFTHGGATRWLSFGPFTFQPVEILKFGFVVYFSAWLSGAHRRIGDIKYGLLPLVILLGIVGGILALQPDIGSFIVIAITGVLMLLAVGARVKHLSIFAVAGLIILGGLSVSVPYINSRITTFINPADDPLGAGYQIQQSLIAVGSGEFTGRGFGQSVQKFNFLPEPVSDSIFAVFAEEWGFMGAIILILLFIFFGLRGLKIASNSPSVFSGLLVLGIVLLIVIQSLINIASMLGVFPLTGMPLLFVSQGGSAMLVVLAEVGVVLGISRSMNKG